MENLEDWNHTRNVLKKRSSEASCEDQDIKRITGRVNPLVAPLGAQLQQ